MERVALSSKPWGPHGSTVESMTPYVLLSCRHEFCKKGFKKKNGISVKSAATSGRPTSRETLGAPGWGSSLRHLTPRPAGHIPHRRGSCFQKGWDRGEDGRLEPGPYLCFLPGPASSSLPVPWTPLGPWGSGLRAPTLRWYKTHSSDCRRGLCPDGETTWSFCWRNEGRCVRRCGENLTSRLQERRHQQLRRHVSGGSGGRCGRV